MELRLRNLTVGLFGTLINPGANQSDLVFGERIAFVNGRHPVVFVADARDVMDEGALGTVTRFDHLSIFAAFKSGSEAVQAELGLLLIRSMAFKARFLENRFDIGGVSHAFLVGGRRELAGIDRFGIFGRSRHCRNSRK